MGSGYSKASAGSTGSVKSKLGRSFTISNESEGYYAKVTEAINSKGEKGILLQNYNRYGDTLGNPEFTKSNTTLEKYREVASRNAKVSSINGKSLNGNAREKRTEQQIKELRKKGVQFRNTVPKGYTKLENATTAPLGYTWYSNGKSMFSGERKTVLVKDKRR